MTTEDTFFRVLINAAHEGGFSGVDGLYKLTFYLLTRMHQVLVNKYDFTEIMTSVYKLCWSNAVPHSMLILAESDLLQSSRQGLYSALKKYSSAYLTVKICDPSLHHFDTKPIWDGQTNRQIR